MAIQSGNAAFQNTNTDNSVQTTDESRTQGLQTGANQYGSNVTLADSAGTTIQMSDQGAIAAGQAIAQAAIAGQTLVGQGVVSESQYAIGRAIDLATTAAQGQGGTLVNAGKVIAVVGLIAAAVFGVAYSTRPRKQREANAPASA